MFAVSNTCKETILKTGLEKNKGGPKLTGDGPETDLEADMAPVVAGSRLEGEVDLRSGGGDHRAGPAPLALGNHCRPAAGKLRLRLEQWTRRVATIVQLQNICNVLLLSSHFSFCSNVCCFC